MPKLLKLPKNFKDLMKHFRKLAKHCQKLPKPNTAILWIVQTNQSLGLKLNVKATAILISWAKTNYNSNSLSQNQLQFLWLLRRTISVAKTICNPTASIEEPISWAELISKQNLHHHHYHRYQ